MAAAVKHLRILNSSSRTKFLTFNLEQIPFVVLVVAAIFPLLSHYLSLFLCPCLCVCLFVCLPICLCTLSAASCICHCQRGKRSSKHVAALNFAQFLLHVLLFFRFVDFLLLLLLYLLPIHCPQSCCGRRRSRRQQRCSVRLQADS